MSEARFACVGSVVFLLAFLSILTFSNLRVLDRRDDVRSVPVV